MERWARARYAAGHKWVSWHTDLDITGSTTDRPALNAARDEAIDNQAKIVVYNINRFSRSVPEGLDALARLQEYGVDVVSASEDLDAATPEGELSLTLFLAIGQYELRRISASWRGVIASNREGGWWHGVPPYGYRHATADEEAAHGRGSGVIVPDDEKSDIVREVFRRYLAGETWYRIGNDLVERGHFTRVNLAGEILRNPAYAGYIAITPLRHRRYKRGPLAGQIQRDKNRRPLREKDPNARPRHFPGRHEPLVSPRDFVRARRRLRAEARPSIPPSATARWSGDRLVECDACGRALAYSDKTATSPTGSDLRYVLCQNKQCNRRGRARIDELEPLLEATVASLGRRLRAEAQEIAAQRRRERRSSAHDPAKLRGDRTKLAAALTQLAADRAVAAVDDDAPLSVEEIDAARLELRRRLRDVDAKLAAAEEREADPPQLALAAQGDTLAELWPAMTYDERAAALDALDVRIVVAAPERRGQSVEGRVRLRLPWEDVGLALVPDAG